MRIEFQKNEEKLLNYPIEDFDFSVRTYNKLMGLGIRSTRALLTYTKDELLAIWQLGQKGVSEIEQRLEKEGLYLRNTNNMELKLIKQIDPVKGETWYIVNYNGNKQYFLHEENAKKRFDELKNITSPEIQETVLETYTIKQHDRVN